MEGSLDRPGDLRPGDELERVGGALEHEAPAAQLHREDTRGSGNGGGAPLERGCGLGDADLASEGEAERLERRGEVLRLRIRGGLRHHGAPEDVEHEHVIHVRSP